MVKYSRLRFEEREQISRFLAMGRSIREIGQYRAKEMPLIWPNLDVREKES